MFWKILNGITHTIMVYRFMDVRERNTIISTGEFRKFCNSKYIKTPIYKKRSVSSIISLFLSSSCLLSRSAPRSLSF